jgi:hypothetical protein
VDLRISQEPSGLTSKDHGFQVFYFLNLGNMINDKWGRIDEGASPLSRNFVNSSGFA